MEGCLSYGAAQNHHPTTPSISGVPADPTLPDQHILKYRLPPKWTVNKTSSLNQGSNLANPPTVDDSKAYVEVCTWQCACVDGVGHRRDSDLHSVDEMNHTPVIGCRYLILQTVNAELVNPTAV